MAHTLLLEDFLDSDKYARLLHITEAIINSCAKEFHRWRETHISVHQRWDVIAQLTDLSVQNEIVFLELLLAEQLLQFLGISLDFQRFHRYNQVLLISKVLMQEIEDHVSSATDI